MRRTKLTLTTIAASTLLLALIGVSQTRRQNAGEATNADVLRIGRLALERYDRGASGDWRPLLDMMTDDVNVRLPLPPDAPLGAKTGKERAVAIYDYVANVQKVRCKLTPTAPPTVNGGSVAFEYISAGTLGGQQVSVPFLVVFDIRGDRLTGVREYIGVRGV